ncbi:MULTISPECIES: PIN domain-containing protein [Thermococcus]|jgi:predicted nucleic acid-binding protein|uniref:Ribonuclease VapC n=1 Tax=Thermococcus nautili TaxID=195522 RepID=W8NUN6_9EURY|nr:MULTISPECIES: PIN domain-containing protein [Thermococcus]AHL22867.1 putative nucleic acid-binding protein, contains PIN domain [Thermococcus nautili]NJE50007.1 PIN domain-containing protein [Thermococcus sp. 9N3]
MTVIDTNVFLYAVLKDSELNEEARNLLASLERWVVPSMVLYELYWFLKKREYSVEDINGVISAVLSSPRTKVVGDNGKYTKEALKLTKNPKRFNDMVILATAKDFGRLATYDKKLRKEAEKLGIKVLP